MALREKRTIAGEREFTTFKGEKRVARITSCPFHDDGGVILGTLSVWVDITEIRRQEGVIAQQNADMQNIAEQAEQVAAVVSSACEELSSQVEQSSRGAGLQRERAQETATAMEQMTITVIEVAKTPRQAAMRSEQAKSKAREGAQIVRSVSQAMEVVRTRALELKDACRPWRTRPTTSGAS